MKEIGGYFGLELSKNKPLHEHAIKLNTGRNALEYIIRAKSYAKIYLPYYTCDVLLQPLQKLKVDFEFYTIDINFEPEFDFQRVKTNEAFLYTNYFGLKDTYISRLPGTTTNVIIDNAQAFYAPPPDRMDTFYSARKFFGVADGAYLYTDQLLTDTLELDVSHARFEHLLRRADIDAQDGYASFVQNEHDLDNAPLRQMSPLTSSILQSVDYAAVAAQRRKNFDYLQQNLEDKNLIPVDLEEQNVPMVYPFLTRDPNLRQKLIDHKIYIPTYWPNVLSWTSSNSIAYQYAAGILPLPIDQRYEPEDLRRIIEVISP